MEVLNNSLSDLSSIQSVQDQTIEGFFKFIAPHKEVFKALNDVEKSVDVVTGKGPAVPKPNRDLVESMLPSTKEEWDKVATSLNDTSLIVFDEATNLNTAEINFIDRLVNNYNKSYREPGDALKVIFSGDNNQLGANKNNFSTNITAMLVPTTDYMKTSMRNAWNYLNNTVVEVQAALERNKTKNEKFETINTTYSLQDNDFIGVNKISSKDSNDDILTGFKEILSAAKTRKEKVFVISSDATDNALVKEANNGIDAELIYYTPEKVQSAEAEYVILLDNKEIPDGGLKFKKYLQYLNTMVTRAKKGIVIYSNESVKKHARVNPGRRRNKAIKQIKLDKYIEPLKESFKEVMEGVDTSYSNGTKEVINDTINTEESGGANEDISPTQEDSSKPKVTYTAKINQGLRKGTKWDAVTDWDSSPRFAPQRKVSNNSTLNILYGVNNSFVVENYSKLIDNNYVKSIVDKSSNEIDPRKAIYFLGAGSPPTGDYSANRTQVYLMAYGPTINDNQKRLVTVAGLNSPYFVNKPEIYKAGRTESEAKKIAQDRAKWLHSISSNYDAREGGIQQLTEGITYDELIKYDLENGVATVGNIKLHEYDNDPEKATTLNSLFKIHRSNNPNFSHSAPYIYTEGKNKGNVMVYVSQLPIRPDKFKEAYEEQKKGITDYGILPVLVNNIGTTISDFLKYHVPTGEAGSITPLKYSELYPLQQHENISKGLISLRDIPTNSKLLQNVQEALDKTKVEYTKESLDYVVEHIALSASDLPKPTGSNNLDIVNSFLSSLKDPNLVSDNRAITDDAERQELSREYLRNGKTVKDSIRLCVL